MMETATKIDNRRDYELRQIQAGVKTLHIDGFCPFLTCLIDEPHDHAICPECGAVRYGNMFCDECARAGEMER